MHAAFDCALNFTKTEKRGGAAPIISYQAIGYALADAKMAIEAVGSLRLRAAHAFDTQARRTLELALHAKLFGSETAVRVISNLCASLGSSYEVGDKEWQQPPGGFGQRQAKSSFRTTGMRFVQLAIMKLAMRSPCGERQVSENPAVATTAL